MSSGVAATRPVLELVLARDEEVPYVGVVLVLVDSSAATWRGWPAATPGNHQRRRGLANPAFLLMWGTYLAWLWRFWRGPS